MSLEKEVHKNITCSPEIEEHLVYKEMSDDIEEHIRLCFETKREEYTKQGIWEDHRHNTAEQVEREIGWSHLHNKKAL